MCSGGKRPMRNLMKVLLVFVFFCYFAECAAGSCLKYGHSCWGAHGKRSGPDTSSQLPKEERKILKPRWFLSRLIQSPVDLGRLIRENELELSSKLGQEPVFSLNELENLAGQDELESASADQLFDEPSSSVENGRFRLPKMMIKRAIKNN